MSHENDIFIFQTYYDTQTDDGIVLVTVIFIRKNENSVYKFQHIKSFFEDDFVNCVLLSEGRYYEEIRTLIKQKNLNEIVPESDEGKEWVKKANVWLTQS
jgi:hypothetical protein